MTIDPLIFQAFFFNCMQKMLIPYIMNAILIHGDINQFAYKKGVFCVDAIVTLLHGIVSGLDKKETTISKVLFLDFSSAFNTVLPNRLVKDLTRFLDEKWLVKWIADYMQGWTRQVKLNKGFSETSDINVGVPQGGPLSALLFTIYTDDLRSDSNCTVLKYADDTTISCNISKSSHRRNQSDYQNFISDIVDKCDEKNLILNPKKSKEIVFQNINISHKGLTETRDEKLSINDNYVERTTSTTYLGVCIDNKLSFTKHISKILSKVYFIVSTLTYIISYFPMNIRIRIFTACILPHIVYSVPACYHFLHVRDRNRILSFLRYCAIIFKLEKTTLVELVNNAARKEFIRLSDNILSNSNHPLHVDLKSMCKNTKYNLRNRAITPKFRTIVFRNSFLYMAALYIQFGTLEPLL